MLKRPNPPPCARGKSNSFGTKPLPWSSTRITSAVSFRVTHTRACLTPAFLTTLMLVGQLTQRFLVFPQLLFIDLSVGDVTDVGEKMHRSIFCVRNNRAVNVNPDDATIFSDIALLQIKGFDLTSYQAQALVPLGVNVGGVCHLVKAAPKKFCFAIVKQRTQRRRDFEPSPIQVKVGGHHQRERLGPRQALFAFA